MAATGKKAGKDLTATSRATNRGFSLLEVLIVIGLIAVVSTLGVSSLTSAFRAGKDGAPRKVALTLREARDRALLRDLLVRMRVDLDKQEYWFEEAPSSYLLPKPDERGLSEREREARDKTEAGAFRESKELSPGKQSLPKGLVISEITSPRAKIPFREGTVDIFFYSSGAADGATIVFTDEEGPQQILTINPLTGQGRIVRGGSKP